MPSKTEVPLIRSTLLLSGKTYVNDLLSSIPPKIADISEVTSHIGGIIILVPPKTCVLSITTTPSISALEKLISEPQK